MNKSNCEKKNALKTSIGGQAVIEGVMMRGPHKIATAVRKPDGEIIIDEKPIGKGRKSKILKLPIIRGCINFFDSMIVGIKALMFSAKFFEVDEDGNQIEQNPGKFEKWLDEKLGSEKATEAVIYVAVCLSLLLSVGLFILLPAVIVGFLKGLIENHILLTLAEGVVRIAIFILYISLVSRMEDIKRVFMYHGAEHKSIHCFESGEELTIENVRRHSRLHPRCGTSFLLIVMVISIVVFSFISWNNPFVRLLLRLTLLPVVAGISYEIIKFAGRHDNLLTRVISAPGKWFQYITTNEPDDSQIEVAIASLKAVIPENTEDAKW
ncbi:MAG: DUF1385 domain-containing protein [Clostridia bacterium]|nr:DUF1385 domain-containing protein [Clostridia bacterium]